MRRAMFVTAALGGLLATAEAFASGEGKAESSWTFNVFLDDSRIGYHEYRLIERPDGLRHIEAEARFDVKFLFINAFRYRHEIQETWAGNCLTEVQAFTNSNGKKTEVEGTLTETGFLLDAGEDERRLGDCIMTFAYWNPEFLKADRLLNPQTGEFLDVDIAELDTEYVSLGGKDFAAECYLVTARQIEVQVCYSAEDQRWLALESPTKGGRRLRYELNT